MKTIRDLEEKKWYRLLKVLRTLSFLFILFLIVYVGISEIPDEVIDYDNSSFLCTWSETDRDAKTYPLEINLIYNIDKKGSKPDNLLISDSNRLCLYGIKGSSGIAGRGLIRGVGYPLSGKNYADLSIITKYEPSLWVYFGYIALALLVVFIIYFTSKRLFYYVMLGTSRPNSDNEDKVE